MHFHLHLYRSPSCKKFDSLILLLDELVQTIKQRSNCWKGRICAVFCKFPKNPTDTLELFGRIQLVERVWELSELSKYVKMRDVIQTRKISNSSFKRDRRRTHICDSFPEVFSELNSEIIQDCSSCRLQPMRRANKIWKILFLLLSWCMHKRVGNFCRPQKIVCGCGGWDSGGKRKWQIFAKSLLKMMSMVRTAGMSLETFFPAVCSAVGYLCVHFLLISLYKIIQTAVSMLIFSTNLALLYNWVKTESYFGFFSWNCIRRCDVVVRNQTFLQNYSLNVAEFFQLIVRWQF